MCAGRSTVLPLCCTHNTNELMDSFRSFIISIIYRENESTKSEHPAAMRIDLGEHKATERQIYFERKSSTARLRGC
jgi:hypothetical protein